MINELRQDFRLNAEEFSYFGALYLYAYSFLQLPIGMAVDRFGVKRTILWCIAICLVGTILLSYTHNLYLAYFSRILMGAGSSCAFMCTLKVVTDYMPIGRRGLFMGATLTLGVMGALVAGKPLSLLMDYVGSWRQTVLATTVVGVIVFLAALKLIPAQSLEQSQSPHDKDKDESLWKSIREILSNRLVIIYAFLALGLYTPLSVMADLWGVGYMMEKFNINRTDASFITMLMYVGLCIGSLILPWLSERFHFLNTTLRLCSWGILISFALILFLPQLTTTSLGTLLIILGVFCGAEMLCFTGVVLQAPPGKIGTTLGITNTVNMLGGALAQQVIGILIDKVYWNGAMDNLGQHVYCVQNYTYSLASLLVVIAGCCGAAYYLPRRR